jgi:hypothetical protein
LIVASIAAVCAAVIVLDGRGLSERRQTGTPSNIADPTLDASAAETADVENSDGPTEAPGIGEGFENAESSSMFGRVSPTDIERALYQRIAEHPGLRMTSLTSVECDISRCRIVFSGTVANPQVVDEYADLQAAILESASDDYRPTQSSLGTRELSPGVREYILEVTYVALVDVSADPRIAARQHAACAGAWARVTQLRGSDEYIRRAHEQAAQYLELAAETLGLGEAERLADTLQFGPLTHECGAMPY